MHQVSKLNIRNSRFENLSATIDGGGKNSKIRIHGSTFGNPNPDKPQDPRRPEMYSKSEELPELEKCKTRSGEFNLQYELYSTKGIHRVESALQQRTQQTSNEGHCS